MSRFGLCWICKRPDKTFYVGMGTKTYTKEECDEVAQQYNLLDETAHSETMKGYTLVYFSGTNAFLLGDFIHPAGYTYKQSIA